MANENFLEKLAGKLADAIDDMTSLEVRTYRGELSHLVTKTRTRDIEEFLGGQNVETFANLKLVRLTKSELDGDTLLFMDDGSTEAGPVPAEISEAHEAAVRSANEMRRGLAELAVGVVRSAL